MAEGRDDRPAPGSPAPDLHSSGTQEFGGVVPPYKGRTTHGESSYGNNPYAVMEQPYAGREISETERQGMPSTDTSGTTPLGVGETHTPQGNEAALKSSEEERRKDREEAGVDAGQPADSSSMPNLRPGDQAG